MGRQERKGRFQMGKGLTGKVMGVWGDIACQGRGDQGGILGLG